MAGDGNLVCWITGFFFFFFTLLFLDVGWSCSSGMINSEEILLSLPHAYWNLSFTMLNATHGSHWTILLEFLLLFLKWVLIMLLDPLSMPFCIPSKSFFFCF